LSARVEAPPPAGHGKPATGSQDAIRLGEGGGRVGEVGQRLAHRDQVEAGRLEDEVLGGHAEELHVLLFVRPRDRQHVVGQVDSDHEPRADPRRHKVGDQPGARPDVQGVLVLARRGEVDQARGDPPVLAAGPRVINGSDSVEKVDQMVDHLV
jgi:hypothetical protein